MTALRGGTTGRLPGVLVVAIITTFLASVGVNLQIRANGQLVVGGAHPMTVAMVNMGLQLAAVLFAVALSRRLRGAIARLAGAIRSGDVRAWWFTGGFVGAFVITLMGVVSPAVGVAVFSIAIVAGQTASSILVDRWGLGPAGRKAITGQRIVSALVAIAAVVLSVSDRFVDNTLSTLAWVGAFIALLGGFAISFQAAANGRLAQVSGQPAIGAGTNFLVGSVALGVIAVATQRTDATSLAGAEPSWWLYGGAFFGLLIVLNTAWAVRYLGLLLLTVIGISGQVLGALVIDLALPSAEIRVTGVLVAGAILTLVAVAIGIMPRGPARASGDGAGAGT